MKKSKRVRVMADSGEGPTEDKKASKKARKAAGMPKLSKVAALDPKAIKSGIQVSLPLLSMLATRTANKYDDALVAFLEVMTEGDNLNRVLDFIKE